MGSKGNLNRKRYYIREMILVDRIDIRKIREFQLKEYNLQAYNKSFKPISPGFDSEILLKKIKGEELIKM